MSDLTREEIEDWRAFAKEQMSALPYRKMHERRMKEIDALCDMALRSLEAAGAEPKPSNVPLMRMFKRQRDAVADALRAALPLLKSHPNLFAHAESALQDVPTPQQQLDNILTGIQENTSALPAQPQSQGCDDHVLTTDQTLYAVAYGPIKQQPGGQPYRVGTSTSAVLEPQPENIEAFRAKAEAWKQYAEHQEHCATCGEAVSDCDTGTALRSAALAARER